MAGYAWAMGQIVDRIRQGWTETDLVFSGDPFPEPNPPRPFVMVKVEGGTSEAKGWGDSGRVYQRQPLTIRIDAFAPVAEGPARPVELAESAGELLARLSRLAGTGGPFLTLATASVSGPWPARGTAGYLNARAKVEGHIDSWSTPNEG
ncbi:hypothetical protein CRT60_16425 [Azospirillum palustre]|uniref:DUF3168 domain-containing protein n=1 Tax=Azospirillum palustre TaxID=2044885 RepID=A0A2B8BH06_9PROT|nr:hypothetical protein [Azospirillum palustre]PGH56507.1 hypothetical protein CRT60_16425 [Azospirillum palustre]